MPALIRQARQARLPGQLIAAVGTMAATPPIANATPTNHDGKKCRNSAGTAKFGPNALKYGRTADGVAAVTIHTRPDANRVQVVIADMGSGLPEGGQVGGQGARMMRVLAAQIGAELSFISGDGFEVALSIPAAQPHP